ncbi:spore germination protein [Clostridium kluyveri]|uniref:Spore germination protein n=1 Tax=Clostridium kluyveri TaxID=1534 RepID=A0A1L5F602_CLOKL|nr:spore germination protein [Clostridium kluyveri]APM38441.1 spore germination protein [Clostridium kluyveri]UZQ50725.1 spore germination protein [Clostridium kluyveri]
MDNKEYNINHNIENIKNLLGEQTEVVVRNLLIGKNNCIEAAIIYLNGLINKDVIDRDILNPLMLHVKEDFAGKKDIEDYIQKRYIAASDSCIERDISNVINSVKRGKTVLIIQNCCNFIIINTAGGNYRAISEPENDLSLRGPREGFVENLETNISILRRRIKDRNLTTEKFTLGRRSQTDLVIMYIDDVVDKEFLKRMKDKISKIDVDFIPANSIIEQCIEEHPYSVLPQTSGSERPDVIEAGLMEGKIAFLLEGTPYVTTYPSIFIEFFQTAEDYYGRTLQAWFIRFVRIIAVFIVISVPGIYITLIKFNPELIPVEYIKSLIEARQGIVLTPFMSLLVMQLTIEFLREGGLRMPGKIGQTISVVGGIIIGDAAIQSKVISSPTLLVAGITTVASFVISNYQMSIGIRALTYPMLILANWLGVLGIVIGWFSILAYLCCLENFGVPYMVFQKSDMKDIFIRAPIWKMNRRPKAIPNNDSTRQSNFGNEKNV